MPIRFPYRSVIFTYPERLQMPCSSHLKCEAFKIKSSLFYLHTGQTVRLIGEDSINRHRPFFWRVDSWSFYFLLFFTNVLIDMLRINVFDPGIQGI